MELAVFEPSPAVPSPAEVCRLFGIQELPDHCDGPGRLEPVPEPAALRLKELVVADEAGPQEPDVVVAGPAAPGEAAMACALCKEATARTCATPMQGLPAAELAVPARCGPEEWSEVASARALPDQPHEERAPQQCQAPPAEPQPPPSLGDGLQVARADCWQQGAATSVQLAVRAQRSPALELDEAPAVVDVSQLLDPRVDQAASQGVVPVDQAPAVVDVFQLLDPRVDQAASQGDVPVEQALAVVDVGQLLDPRVDQAAPQGFVPVDQALAVVGVGQLLDLRVDQAASQVVVPVDQAPAVMDAGQPSYPRVDQAASQGVVPVDQAPAVVDVGLLLGQGVGPAALWGGVPAEQATPQAVVLAEQALAAQGRPAGPVALRAEAGLAVPKPNKAKLASISRPASSVLCAKEIIAPETHHTYAWLMNEIAVPRMQLGDLGGAYSQLVEANVLHMKLYGTFSGDAMYNLACCLSRGAAAPLGGSASAACASGLPPFLPGASVAEVAEARLDLAVGMLESAVVAGYGDAANVLADPDLQAIRRWRPERFAAVARRLAGEVVPLGSVAVAERGVGEDSLGALVLQAVAGDPPMGTDREDWDDEGWEDGSDDGGAATIAEQFAEQFADSWASFAESVRSVFGQSLTWASILGPLVPALLDTMRPRLLGLRALASGPPVGDCGCEPEPEDDEEEDDDDGCGGCGSGSARAVLASGGAEAAAPAAPVATAEEPGPEEPGTPATVYPDDAEGCPEDRDDDVISI